MNRKTFLASLLTFGFWTQTKEEKTEKIYPNGQCPVCETPVTDWLQERKCTPSQSKDVIKPQEPYSCNEVTGSPILQQHVCQKCRTIFAYTPMGIRPPSPRR